MNLYMHAQHAYIACIMKESPERKIQYTIRNVPNSVDKQLREKAAEDGLSLNEATLKTLQEGLGDGVGGEHDDFDAYANTWIQDESVDEALREFDRVEDEMWE